MVLTKDRYYPQHPVGKPVQPELLNNHLRLLTDGVSDLQTSFSQMIGGATGLAIIGAGAVTAVFVMFPGFGYNKPPVVDISGGGGSGAKAKATIKNGRVSAITVTVGGAGYTSTPTITITP
jgi:hypothetical protein